MKIALVSDSWHPCGVREVMLVCIKCIKLLLGSVRLIGARYSSSDEKNGAWLSSVSTGGTGYRLGFVLTRKDYLKVRDILHEADLIVHHALSTTALFVIYLGKRMGKKLIFHAHTQADEYVRSMFHPVISKLISPVGVPVFNLWVKHCCKSSDLVIVPTDYFAEMMQKRLALKVKPTVWTAPLNLPENFPRFGLDYLYNRGDRKIPKDYLLLLYIGRIGGEKRIKKLLAVFAALRKRNPRVGLMLIGQGNIRKFRSLADKLPNNSGSLVSFTDRLNHEEVLGLTSTAAENGNAIGITLSNTETQGMGIFEQMYMGLPVAAPRNTCFDATVSACDGGILLNEDTDSCANQLSLLINDKPRRIAQGQKGKAYIRENYSEEKQFEELAQIYRTVLAG